METRPVRRPFGQTGTASKSFSHIPEEERDDLRPGTRSIRRECGLRRAGGNALLHRPQHRLVSIPVEGLSVSVSVPAPEELERLVLSSVVEELPVGAVPLTVRTGSERGEGGLVVSAVVGVEERID